jgi:hypothetical protein
VGIVVEAAIFASAFVWSRSAQPLDASAAKHFDDHGSDGEVDGLLASIDEDGAAKREWSDDDAGGGGGDSVPAEAEMNTTPLLIHRDRDRDSRSAAVRIPRDRDRDASDRMLSRSLSRDVAASERMLGVSVTSHGSVDIEIGSPVRR